MKLCNAVDVAPPIDFPSRERSPFADLSLPDDLVAGDTRLAVTTGLTRKQADAVTQCGQLLASAIWNGALLAREWWQPFVAALPTGVRLDRSLWVEMAGSESSRRWFADPISQILILRWCVDHDHTAGLTAESCITSYLRSFRDPTDTDDIVDEFIRAAELRWRMRMPGVLVDYAMATSSASPCSSATWRRLMTGRAVPEDSSRARITGDQIDWSNCGRWTQDEAHHQRMVKALNEACGDHAVLSKTQQANDVLKTLRAITGGPSVSPAANLLRCWCIAMMTNGLAARGKNYKPGTARDYLKTVRRKIFAPGSEAVELSFGAGDLEQRCRDAVARMPAGDARNTLIKAVYSLQRFLQGSANELQFEAKDLKSFYSKTPGRVYLVSSADFMAALRSLRDRSALDVRMLRICLLLGFRAGLRLPEIRALTVHDITVFESDGERHIELIVRRQRHANTKTEWSRRILPMHLLLASHPNSEQCEITEFLAWLEQGRRLYCLTQDPRLFVFPERPTERVKHGENLEAPLVKILRRVTGDVGIEFGSLRHSFISNLLATMLLPADDACLVVPHGLDANALSVGRNRRLKCALIGGEKLGQGALHAVSQLVGHDPVTTTLSTYAHLLDWSVGAHVCRPAVQRGFTNEDAAAMTGMSEAAVRKAMQRGGEPAPSVLTGQSYTLPVLIRSRRGPGRAGQGTPPSVYIDRILSPSTKHLLRVLTARKKSLVPGEPVERRAPIVHASTRPPAAEWLNWRLVRAVLDLDHSSDLAVRQIAERYDLPEGLASQWVRNRQQFAPERHYLIAIGPRRGQHLTSRALRRSPKKNAALAFEQRNFPRRPDPLETALADKLWAEASKKAHPLWQRGLEVFRQCYNGERNAVLADSWTEAKAFREVIAGLGVLKHFEVLHRPPRGRPRRQEQLSSLLVRNYPPRGWKGGVLFRFKAQGLGGRGYSLRFVLTMLTITDAATLAAARRSRPTYQPAERPSGCLFARKQGQTGY